MSSLISSTRKDGGEQFPMKEGEDGVIGCNGTLMTLYSDDPTTRYPLVTSATRLDDERRGTAGFVAAAIGSFGTGPVLPLGVDGCDGSERNVRSMKTCFGRGMVSDACLPPLHDTEAPLL